MNCRECEEKLAAYDDLTAEQRLEISEHAKQCPDCESKLAGIVIVKQAIVMAPKPLQQHPAAFASRVMNAIAVPEKKRERAFGRLFSPVPRLAMAGLSIILIVFLVAEQQVHDTSKRTPGAEFRGEARLDSPTFLKNVQASVQHEGNSLLTLYECARQENCENTLVKSLRLKFTNNQSR